MDLTTLKDEQLALGARFAGEGGTLASPSSYEGEPRPEDLEDDVALVDLSGMLLLLASGAQAASFGGLALAGPKLAVGDCSLQASLLGDGALASIPFAARTGDAELLVMDPWPRHELLHSWMGFLRDVDQDGVRPFGGLDLDDMSDRLVPLALVGSAARLVLQDYVRGTERLPEPGEVVNLDLDGHITTIVASPAGAGDACLLLLVPPACARVVWRSLLSFAVVTPLGHEGFLSWSRRRWRALGSCASQDRVRVSRAQLERDGLVRPGSDFVGARGLDD
ncbi:hypothetical protein [Olsenella sp. HMSC062G07]|uniref:hypothetical protein n=1 Tax=Olsenella sp. HMSC062G07 TaxID=1739330 RepID=UPI0008A21C0F|nr:hypothetical protein [Olsenella sp. HMSC062G07]OFK24677.1 hypothetical protein HMPREF2826_07220 [Olsenella sp. HMSC062G07]